jgi:hypothetical protein
LAVIVAVHSKPKATPKSGGQPSKAIHQGQHNAKRKKQNIDSERSELTKTKKDRKKKKGHAVTSENEKWEALKDAAHITIEVLQFNRTGRPLASKFVTVPRNCTVAVLKQELMAKFGSIASVKDFNIRVRGLDGPANPDLVLTGHLGLKDGDKIAMEPVFRGG